MFVETPTEHPPVTRPILSVIIPTYKEAARLPQTLDEIIPFLSAKYPSHEILVVDDNSPDGTGQVVKDYAKGHPAIRLITQPGKIGKGAAVRRGCIEATADYVLFMDADHSTPIQELDQFFVAMATPGCGAVAGVRTYQEDESRGRRIVGLLGQLLAHTLVFRKAVVDSQCGFKLFTRQTVQRIFPLARVNGGMLDVELFYLMHKFGVTCRFVPVSWTNKPDSRINVLACMVRDPLDMLGIRVRDFFGAYAPRATPKVQPWVVKA
jgi:dolichyl-phosphate beta-glucosyltransferase